MIRPSFVNAGRLLRKIGIVEGCPWLVQCIEMHDGESQHFGAPVFKRAEYALHELDRLVHRHPDSDELARLLRQIRARHSEREMDGVSLMLTEASQEKLPCMQAVTWQPGRTWWAGGWEGLGVSLGPV